MAFFPSTLIAEPEDGTARGRLSESMPMQIEPSDTKEPTFMNHDNPMAILDMEFIRRVPRIFGANHFTLPALLLHFSYSVMGQTTIIDRDPSFDPNQTSDPLALSVAFHHTEEATMTVYSFPDSPNHSFDLLALTVHNDSGADWISYTLGLPGLGNGGRGNFGGFSIVSGGFSSAAVTPDWGSIGLSGGTVPSGSSFSVSLGIYHRQQTLVGTPTSGSYTPGNPYEPPSDPTPGIPVLPPLSDWTDISYENSSEEPISNPPSSPPGEPSLEWWTMKTSTRVVNGMLVFDAIVRYRERADGTFEYSSNTPDGYAGPTGVFDGSLEQLLDWQTKYLNGNINSSQGPTTPEPEGYAGLFAAALAGWGMYRRGQATKR